MPIVNVKDCYDGALLIMLRSQYNGNSLNFVIEAFIQTGDEEHEFQLLDFSRIQI